MAGYRSTVDKLSPKALLFCFQEEILYPQRVNRAKKVIQVDFRFSETGASGPGGREERRGRGGGRGGGRGFGERRGGFGGQDYREDRPRRDGDDRPRRDDREERPRRDDRDRPPREDRPPRGAGAGPGRGRVSSS